MRTLIASSFFLLAAWFLLGSPAPDIPLPEPVRVDPADIARDAVKPMLPDPPRVRIGGVMQKCQDCHRIFDSLPSPPSELRQHTHIVFDHGRNNRCYNCHSISDHDRLALQGDEEIGFDQVEELCAKCHGPTWRDWNLGVHGRTRGSWDPGDPEHLRTRCTECHDPHSPAFPPIRPLPGPNTLRMRATEARDRHADEPERNPLMKWRLRADQEPHAAPDHGGGE